MTTKTAIPRWAKGLDEREVLFVREYLKDLCLTDAYLRLPGVTDNRGSAKELGHRMGQRPHVAAAIEAAMFEDGSGPRQWLTTKLRSWADADIADFYEWVEGEPGQPAVQRLKRLDQLPREVRSRIKEITTNADGSLRLKLHDSLRAAEILGKVGAIALTREHVVVEDPALQQTTPDLELARRIAFLLTKAARKAPSP